MKVGMSLGISPREPISHTVQVVQNAERLGFDSVWIMTSPPGGGDFELAELRLIDDPAEQSDSSSSSAVPHPGGPN